MSTDTTGAGYSFAGKIYAIRLADLEDIASQAQDAADASRDPGEVGYARGLRNALLIMRGEAGGEGLAP